MNPTIDQVRAYWNANPLLSYEVAEVGSPAFFDYLDAAKRNDIERFAMPYWDFSGYGGKRVLDIGCGPGWVTVQYAAGGAVMNSIDLTERAAELARAHLAYRGLPGTVEVGNAEQLHFPDNTFDLAVASGVLHHTPDTMRTFHEAFRVVRPGGRAKITLYRKGILHSGAVFGLTRLAMRLVGMKHPGADLSRTASDVDDFIRQYDGADNPIGIGKADWEWQQMLEQAGFVVRHQEVHFFPRRFIPAGDRLPVALHRALDAAVGTMIYFDLVKPE